MKFQNSYIFLKNPYTAVKKTEKKDATIVLTTGRNIYSYIKRAFPTIKKDDNCGTIYKTKYTCKLQTDKYKCNVEFIKIEVSKIQYLDIVVEGKTQTQIVRCLEDVQNTLLSSEIKENYIYIISYDSVSEYYCNKILPKLNSLERNLRKLMFNIYILNFDHNYYQATISEDIQTKIKGIIRATGNKEEKEIKRLQEFFYSLEFGDIQKILFTPSWTMIDEQKQKEFLEKNNDLSELTDEELRKAFSDFSPKSDWERFFSEKITIPNIEEIIKRIRNYRNMIAHFKFFYRADYDSCFKLINELNSAILNAIQLTEEKDFAEKNAEIFKDLLSSFAEKMNAVNSPIIHATQKFVQSETFELLSNINKKVREDGIYEKLVNPALKSVIPETWTKQQTTLEPVKSVLPNIPDMRPQFLKDIQREQNVLQSNLGLYNIANINATLNLPNFTQNNINPDIEIVEDTEEREDGDNG